MITAGQKAVIDDPSMAYLNYWLQQLAVLSLLVAPVLSFQDTRAAPRLCRTTATPGIKTNVGRAVMQQTHTIKCRLFPLPLFSAGTCDFDAFMDELDTDANNVAAEETKKNEPSHFIQRKADVGIGGNSGFIYNVNSLKRNLVQESVRGCKQELLALLGDGRQHSDGALAPRWRRHRDDLIEERLSALVQVCLSAYSCFGF